MVTSLHACKRRCLPNPIYQPIINSFPNFFKITANQPELLMEMESPGETWVERISTPSKGTGSWNLAGPSVEAAG